MEDFQGPWTEAHFKESRMASLQELLQDLAINIEPNEELKYKREKALIRIHFTQEVIGIPRAWIASIYICYISLYCSSCNLGGVIELEGQLCQQLIEGSTCSLELRVVIIPSNKMGLILELGNSRWGLSLVDANLEKNYSCLVHVCLSALYLINLRYWSLPYSTPSSSII